MYLLEMSATMEALLYMYVLIVYTRLISGVTISDVGTDLVWSDDHGLDMRGHCSFTFSVGFCGAFRLELYPDKSLSLPKYEIFIDRDSLNKYKNGIKKYCDPGRRLCTNNGMGISGHESSPLVTCDGSTWTPFWISWNESTVRLGNGDIVGSFVLKQVSDPEFKHIDYVKMGADDTNTSASYMFEPRTGRPDNPDMTCREKATTTTTTTTTESGGLEEPATATTTTTTTTTESGGLGEPATATTTTTTATTESGVLGEPATATTTTNTATTETGGLEEAATATTTTTTATTESGGLEEPATATTTTTTATTETGGLEEAATATTTTTTATTESGGLEEPATTTTTTTTTTTESGGLEEPATATTTTTTATTERGGLGEPATATTTTTTTTTKGGGLETPAAAITIITIATAETGDLEKAATGTTTTQPSETDVRMTVDNCDNVRRPESENLGMVFGKAVDDTTLSPSNPDVEDHESATSGSCAELCASRQTCVLYSISNTGTCRITSACRPQVESETGSTVLFLKYWG